MFNYTYLFCLFSFQAIFQLIRGLRPPMDLNKKMVFIKCLKI